MQPIIQAQVFYTDDARDEIANHFCYRKGLKHNFFVWENYRSESDTLEMTSSFAIKNFKPDADLVVLDCTDVQVKNEFILEVRQLMAKYGATAEWLPNAEHLPPQSCFEIN